MPTLKELRGLMTSDRSEEEQRAINELMGYKEKQEYSVPKVATSMPAKTQPESPVVPAAVADTETSALLNNVVRYQQQLDSVYEKTLAEKQQDYGVDREGVNTNANDYIKKISQDVSSYFKRYQQTDYLPLTDKDYKELAAEYDTKKEVYGEEHANIWLDNHYKDIVGTKQPWWQQAIHAVSHLVPAIEGGAIQAVGNLYGALAHITGNGFNDNPDLNGWNSFLADALDNPITRYGRDVERAGASNVVQGFESLIGLSDETASDRIAAMKNTATKYNPEGIGADAIVTTSEQDDQWISSASPWTALQSGGFTALSMVVGSGLANAAKWIFGGLAKGMVWANNTGKAFKTAEGLEKGLTRLKKVQNFTDVALIPGAVGSMEGAMEGLNTKIDVERNATQELDEYYKQKVSEEAKELYNNEQLNPMVKTGDGTYTRKLSPEAAFKQTWDKYAKQYTEARRQIEWAATKAGIDNFWANSLINGLANTTLKAGLMAPRVQESLRNFKLTGWAYRKPKFKVDAAGNVTPKLTKLGTVKQILKEPAGEGLEEYLQSLSNDTFSEAAENNINEFIRNKFEGDGTAKVTDSFGSDYAAAWTALKGSVVNKESIESAILGAMSSAMGTVGGIGRGYHRDAKGNLVRNSMLDPRNLTRSLTSEGQLESWIDYARRATPWRSGLVNAYFDRRQEQTEADETAAMLTEWMKNPQNKAKWDGLVGTANWMTQMQNAAESNDQFSYRKAQMGKAINDILMLDKLKGTSFYDAVVTDLQRAATMDVSSQEAQNMIQQIRQNGGEEYSQKSDEDIVEKIQSNANQMLGLMTTVEKESKSLDRLLGRVDEDTKQSLIFGKVMTQDFTQRRDQLNREIDNIKSRIHSSRNSSQVNLTDDQKALILKYGSLTQALKAQEKLQQEKDKIDKHIEELEKIDSKKTSDKQKEDLVKSKKQQKTLTRELQGFEALKDEEGHIDSSIATLVLNEEDIMSLDPVTRAMVLAQGANRLYNATHQDRQKVDRLNLEIDEVQHQIDALEAQKQQWTHSDGGVKKGHNKQYQRNTQKIAELQKEKDKKLRQLDAEQGKHDSKPVYSQAQQEVIDNLIQQGMAQDADFLDKVADMGRLERGIKDYHTQYQAILSDPRAFHNYVQRAKYNAQRDLTRRRAERIASIQNYEEYAQELDKLAANASEQEVMDIKMTLMRENEKQKKAFRDENGYTDKETGELYLPEGVEQPLTNYDRYVQNAQKQADLIHQFAKNPNLTDNDMSLLLNAMQYLSSKGVDVADREAAVQTLIEKDEEGNIGGLFRQFVEARNAMVPTQQRAFMPVFTSIGQVVGQYVDLLNGQQEDAINKGNISPTIQPVATQPQPTEQTPSEDQPQVSTTPTPTSPAPTQQPETGSSLFDIAYNSPEGGQFLDTEGTVATDSQTTLSQQRAQQEQSKQEAGQKSELKELLEAVTTPELAKMVDDASQVIENSNALAVAKGLAKQYLWDLGVNRDERYDTIDDILTAIQEQVKRLKEMSNKEEEDNNRFDEAAGLLQKVYGSLTVKKMRGGRTLPSPSSRPENPRASWIHTANIAYMEKVNPDAWAVQFTNQHAIDEWNRDHVIASNTPVYFITDSEWTAEVTRQMQPTPEVLSINPNHRQYNTLTDMPIVAAVRIDTPSNPQTTTAIEVEGLWYQPIGIMPSSKAKSSGAALTEAIRKNASKEQGRHLVTTDGLPNGTPLTTRVFGANYLTAHHPDAQGQTKRDNSKANNTEVIEDILLTLPRASEDRLRSLSREEVLADSEYQEARAKFLNGLVWDQEKERLTYIPANLREGEKGSPMLIFSKPVEESVGRTTGKPLLEVVQNGTGEELVNFNSRTQRLYNEVIRPLFQFLPMKDKHGDLSAKVITKEDMDANSEAYQEEAERLSQILNGYGKGLHGVGDFIYFKPGQGWSITVRAPKDLQVAGDMNTSQTVFKVFFQNQDATIAPIEIGTIRAGQKDTDSAMELLRNIIYDAQAGQIRDFLKWQVPKQDARNTNNPSNGNARRNMGAIVDDGILTLAGSSLVYDIDGVKLKAPITASGKIQYPNTTVVNPQNAQTSSSQNITPQGDGAVITPKGQIIEPDSGATLEDKNDSTPATPSASQESQKLKKAKETTSRIIEDSKQFKLSEDETYYYIEDKATGERTKYLRVTTVIGATDLSQPWTPTIEEIINKLKERHTVSDLSAQQIAALKDMTTMSKELGIPIASIKRAIAELRTQHKKEGYGAWSTPSTAIGNTADAITRDFLAGHLKETYPNITKESLEKFVHQLEVFKSDLEARGIHIVSEGVMAHGKITMTDDLGHTRDVNVAGTLDLFGYDDEGNFYIFDMKTTRDHSDSKLIKEQAKWSRQVSMYADLLRQTYPNFTIDPSNLRIIPINVSYPTPVGKKSDYLDPTGPKYSVKDDGQLMMAYRSTSAGNEQSFMGSNLTMRGTLLSQQFQPGYTSFHINWDNLSSEDQDIAAVLDTQVEDGQPLIEQSTQQASIETPEQPNPSFFGTMPSMENSQDIQESVHKAPPVVANGEQSVLPKWNNLPAKAKVYLAENWRVESLSDYNNLLNNPADAEACQQELECHGLV